MNCEYHETDLTRALATADDVVRIVSSSGAGYGDPTKRNPEAVPLDIKNGFLSEEEAKLIHGIGGRYATRMGDR